MEYKKPGMKWYSFLTYWEYFFKQILSMPYYVIIILPFASALIISDNIFLFILGITCIFDIIFGFVLYAHLRHFSTSIIKLVIFDYLYNFFVFFILQSFSIENINFFDLIIPVINIIYLYKRRFLFVNKYSIFKKNENEIEIDCDNLDPYIDYLNNKEKVLPNPELKYIFCRKCGAKLDANSKFCNKCGTEVIRMEEKK